MKQLLKNEVALVTGAGSGIGRAIALKLSREGAQVAVNDLSDEKTRKTVEEIREQGGKALPATADITDYTQVLKMVKQVIGAFGKITILVNNAGVLNRLLFIETENNDWEREINVNLYGMLNCTRAVLQNMVENNYGKIINISSDAARAGEPRLSIYAATKAAVLGFTKALAKEVGKHNINVNVICPGATWTPLVSDRLKQYKNKMVRAYPLQRFAQPLDIANGVFFLSSDLANFITGQTLSINGGYLTT